MVHAKPRVLENPAARSLHVEQGLERTCTASRAAEADKTEECAEMSDRPAHRQSCRKCGETMRPVLRIPPVGADHGLVVLDCPACGTTDTVLIDSAAWDSSGSGPSETEGGGANED